MLFILSRNRDTSTNNVLKWLNYYSVPYERINFADFIRKNISLSLELSEECGRILRIGNNVYNEEDIKNSFVWYRKGDVFTLDDADQFLIENKNILSHVKEEYNALFLSFVSILKDATWLCDSKFRDINKLDILIKAQQCGLHIPNTIITNRKEYITRACEGDTITKCIDSGLSIELPDGNVYLLSTNKFTKEHFKELPDRFFPSTLQSYVTKKYELRIFFIGNKYFSTAIFSQKYKLTEIDFRLSVAGTDQCRMVPYSLPDEIREKLIELMDMINLNTGSIDMIVTPDKKYFFLEVNPYGQYGWHDNLCNFEIDKEIALYIIEQISQPTLITAKNTNALL